MPDEFTTLRDKSHGLRDRLHDLSIRAAKIATAVASNRARGVPVISQLRGSSQPLPKSGAQSSEAA